MLRRYLWLLACLSRALSQAAVAESSFHLPAPQNVTIVSNNFQSTLKWSPVMGINNSAVSYRVEYRTASTDWREVNKPEYYFTNDKPEYYFTDDIKTYVNVAFRVRAKQGELRSDWVETSSFRASDQTILGPPREINVTAEANSLIVSYKEPFDTTASFFVFEYNIIYWEKSTSSDPPSPDMMVVVITKRTEYRLENLKEMTEYCLHLQAVIPKTGLHGHFSDTYCKKTSRTETNLYWLALPLIVAVVLVLILSCLLVLQKYQNVIKSLWRPPLTIPLHYEEDLENPQMAVIEEFQNCAGEDQWDSVSVISSKEQNPTETNNIGDSSQEVQMLETEELR